MSRGYQGDSFSCKTFSQEPGEDEIAHVISCPVCGSDSFRPGVWPAEGFAFGRCSRCGVFYQNPQPRFEDLQKRYDGNYCRYEVDNGEAFLGLMEKALQDVRFDRIEAAAGPGSGLVDVGCATGRLVKVMADRGWRASGVELCREAAEYGREQYGADIRIGTLETAGYGTDSQEVVHASHLIEHLNQPVELIREARRILRPGGWLILTTPNASGLQARWFKGQWRSAIADHLVLFPRTTLERLLAREGFRVKKTKTWGGLGVGAGPRLLKSVMDPLAKAWGFGDVMVAAAQLEKPEP